MKYVIRILLIAALTAVIIIACSSLIEKYIPPKEFEYVNNYALGMRVYCDPTNGRLYLFKPGLGTFNIGELTLYDTVPPETTYD